VRFEVYMVMKIQVVMLCSDMVSYYVTTWCHNPEDHDLRRNRW
jgi:hypothetical protein